MFRPSLAVATRVVRGLTLFLTLTVLLVPSVHAQTINKCQSKKKTCVAKKEAALLNCHVKAEKTGAAVDPTCLQKAQTKFDGGADPTKGCFAKLEAKGGCLTTNDSATLESQVETFVNQVVMALDPGFPTPVTNKCSAAKKKCVATKAKGLLKCHAKAELKGFLDATCVQKVETKFDDPVKGCFAKAETKPPCLTTGDTAALEGDVDTFVHNVVCALDSATPGCACPTTYEFAVSPSSDADFGWTGLWHDNRSTVNVGFGGTVSGCANPAPPCGQCTVSGPSASPGPGLQYRRCLDDSSIACTLNSDCTGINDACVVYLGPPQPQGIGGVSVCSVASFAGTITGTVNVETGDSAIPVALLTRTYTGPTLDLPCPSCNFGSCNGGPRNGQACAAGGLSGVFGNDIPSLDCPPSAGMLIANRSESLTLSTGTQALVVAATSPACTAVGWSGKTCECSTCNNLAATPCHTTSDCLAVGATTCGGKRCLGGTNAGVPCILASECPSGVCNVPGETTAANQCNDLVCTPNPADTDSSNEGECAAGPLEKFCTIQTYRGCNADSDCPAAGDTCNAGKLRECFTDNGTIGGSVSVTGVASPTAPTLGAITCLGPAPASALNTAAGLPGVGRYSLPGTLTMN